MSEILFWSAVVLTPTMIVLWLGLRLAESRRKMRRAAIVASLMAIGLGGSAGAQQQAPAPAVAIELKLSPEDQADLRGICVLAVRSPQVTDGDAVLAVAEFCVRMRNAIALANAKAKNPPADKPKE